MSSYTVLARIAPSEDVVDGTKTVVVVATAATGPGGTGGSGLPPQWTADNAHGDVVATVDDITKTALTVQALAGQTAPLLDVKDATGADAFSISPTLAAVGGMLQVNSHPFSARATMTQAGVTVGNLQALSDPSLDLGDLALNADKINIDILKSGWYTIIGGGDCDTPTEDGLIYVAMQNTGTILPSMMTMSDVSAPFPLSFSPMANASAFSVRCYIPKVYLLAGVQVQLTGQFTTASTTGTCRLFGQIFIARIA